MTRLKLFSSLLWYILVLWEKISFGIAISRSVAVVVFNLFQILEHWFGIKSMAAHLSVKVWLCFLNILRKIKDSASHLKRYQGMLVCCRPPVEKHCSMDSAQTWCWQKHFVRKGAFKHANYTSRRYMWFFQAKHICVSQSFFPLNRQFFLFILVVIILPLF